MLLFSFCDALWFLSFYFIFYFQIQIISPPRSSYAVGDKIQFRVDLFDGYGNRRKLGGDEVRARLTSKTGNASVAAEVEDMRNGSYVATAVLQWQGATCVQVYLTYPREFIREAVRLRLTLHSTVWPVMKFSSGSVKEVKNILFFFSHPFLARMTSYDVYGEVFAICQNDVIMTSQTREQTNKQSNKTRNL